MSIWWVIALVIAFLAYGAFCGWMAYESGYDDGWLDRGRSVYRDDKLNLLSRRVQLRRKRRVEYKRRLASAENHEDPAGTDTQGASK